MSDYKLKDGTDINFDLSKITMREYRSLFDTGQPQEVGDSIVGKTCGLTAEQLGDLSFPDYRSLMSAFFKRAREPQDPNSDSAST